MKTFVQLLSKYQTHIKKYNKNEIISFEGDICNSIRIVVSGRVVISSITSSGKEIIYKDLTINDIFGNNLVFSKSPFYRGNIVCIDKVTLYEFKKEKFLKLLKEDEEFLSTYLSYQSEDAKRLNEQIKVESLNTTNEKIFYLLQVNNHSLKIKSVSDLARKLNISREATSRALHQLIRESKITYNNKVIKDK